MRRGFKAAYAAFVTAGLALMLSGAGCASKPDTERITDVFSPDYEIYKANVDEYIQKQCGTLDCHGQPGRAYRIYGFQGFRLYSIDAGVLVSGQQVTQEAEIRANFQAAVGLEPEEMTRLMARQGDDPFKLLLLRKPLRYEGERHKGGQVMSVDDPGYRCVVAWLQVKTFRGDGSPIPPAERAGLTPRQVEDCVRAKSFR